MIYIIALLAVLLVVTTAVLTVTINKADRKINNLEAYSNFYKTKYQDTFSSLVKERIEASDLMLPMVLTTDIATELCKRKEVKFFTIDVQNSTQKYTLQGGKR